MSSRPTFPLNAWYVAAWDAEVGRTLLARTICGQQMVLYRKTDGSAVALADACWHRLVPLSIGTLIGDEVRCGYHGLRFDGNGRCTHMPSQETINPSACVRSYPIVERHRFIWVWPGDPSLADPTKVPDLRWMDDPAWAGDGRMVEVKADYRLVLDNLMDLTHETYVHGSSIGNEALSEAPFDAVHGETTATVRRWVLDEDPPPFWGAQLGKPGKVDRWQIIHFKAPSTIVLDVGVAPAGSGAPEGDRSQGVGMWVVHIPTPSTEKTCLYFWCHLRNYRIREQRITRQILDAGGGILVEDETVIEAQQRALDANPNREFYNLNIDAGSLWARRLIDQMVDEELEGRQAVRSTPIKLVGAQA
ncbi:aromatic ring-hydroxylating dioxygenase subunit alpha [Burkholderia cenocepacia]|uniref:aromatic ring-hydroxylating dioxygenase subunit alpha n=1 Tax=Burkholderia cenocepacia TaxID=95486 RepID=UPI00285ECF92|nr:aromatic ring-hydroxylating dioxygenase subunit alpha [Burkholderia cenocepacia]MDR8071391.1 aromatic ring-hydroxylating dioxygenase subunit alpha [Burkholderia cenocepacia]